MDDPSTFLQKASLVVTLLSASLAWIAFRFARYDRKRAEYDSTRRALDALRQDLSVIAEWAGSYERKSRDEYRLLRNGEYYESWRRPHRTIFRFNHDAVRAIRRSPPTANFDEKLLFDLAVLDHAITNFFSLVDRYERIVQGDARLLRETVIKMNRESDGYPVDYTPEEKELQELTFRLNYQLHTKGIGAEEDVDKSFPGLHWGYLQTSQSVDRVEKSLKNARLFSYEHGFYAVGDTLAFVFPSFAVSIVVCALAGFPTGLARLLCWLFG